MLGGSSGVTRADRSCSEQSSSGALSRQIMSALPRTGMGSGRDLGDTGTRRAFSTSALHTSIWC
eukprot:14211633-Alexandrium_andersonii.AAC.1